jgi:hypothetical protein
MVMGLRGWFMQNREYWKCLLLEFETDIVLEIVLLPIAKTYPELPKTWLINPRSSNRYFIATYTL